MTKAKPKPKAAKKKAAAKPKPRPFGTDNSPDAHGKEVSRKSVRMNPHVIHHNVEYEDGTTLLHLEFKEAEPTEE